MQKFKYHPDPLNTGAFLDDEKATCDCCERDTAIYYLGSFYAEEEIEVLCPECIASGKAAETFEGTFVDEESIEEVDNELACEELLYRTPSYMGMQQERWLAHCNDYCEFLGQVKWSELVEHGLIEEIKEDKMLTEEWDLGSIEKTVDSNDDLQLYLFRCRHCGKHRIWIDEA